MHLINAFKFKWLTVVNVGGRAQPQLRTAFPRGEHDGEVVLTRHYELALLFARHLCDTATQL